MTIRTIPKPTKSQKSHAEKELQKIRESLREKGKTNKDIKRIEKTMLEKGIFSHDKASEYLDWMDQAKKPVSNKVNEINSLKNLIGRQDDQLSQLTDELKDAKEQAEFCRKQINHYLALVNILTRGT